MFFTADDSFADVFCIVFHKKFWKNEDSDDMRVFSFSIEKVSKMGFENVREPWLLQAADLQQT